MTDPAWSDATLSGARPQAVAALLRYFRDLDAAEEAFHDACLRALNTFPHNALPPYPSRPPAVPPRLRYSRDRDGAEGASQDACLRALKTWPEKGPPRDPTAWLILV